MNDIKSFLSEYVFKKIILLKKRAFSNLYFLYGESDEVVLLRNILSKDSFSSDDINDLLLCYSDHFMDDFELLDFTCSRELILYEMDEVCLDFDVRNIIIYYLLQSSNIDVFKGVLKLFSSSLIENVINDDIISYSALNKCLTIYDLYNCFLDIYNEKENVLRKKKAVSFMCCYDIKFLLNNFRLLGITFDDISFFIKDYENIRLFDVSNLSLLFKNIMLIIDNSFDRDVLRKSVLLTYKEYTSSHLYFTLDEFIEFYNSTVGSNFSSFYYSKYSLLNRELLYIILNNDRDSFCNFDCFREYLGKSKSLSIKGEEWKGEVNEFALSFDNYNRKKEYVLSNYDYLLEELKRPISVTINYFIYLNVSEEYQDTFYDVVKWFYSRDKKYFGRNIFFDSDEVKKNTFDLILLEWKKDIYADIHNRDIIHKAYLEFIRKMVGYKYISIKEWKNYLDGVFNQYFASYGLIHIKEMINVISDNGSLLMYQEENFSLDDFKYMCASLNILYPSLKSDVLLVQKKLYDELACSILIRRQYVDELMLKHHSFIIREFINGDYISKTHYLNVSGINSLRFDRAVNVIKEFNPDLYGQYINKIRNSIFRNSIIQNDKVKLKN
ncbi:MAG: hypothetical protein ACI4XM_04545 [Candidatus Coprovivens sp.]